MWKQLLVAAILAGSASIAWAQEVCGDGADNDGDGFADESCYPGLTSQLVDSPLSTRDTGLISPSTGSLYYPVPADVAVRTPLGPDLVMRRTYASMLELGASPPAWKNPMGDRWVHGFMGWLTDLNQTLVIRLPSGQEIVAVKTGGCNFQTRAGQATQGLVHCKNSTDYTITLLDGTKLLYQKLATDRIMLKRIQGVATNQFLDIEYAVDGQIAWVIDGEGARKLVFSYTSGQLASVQLQVGGVTHHTTTYAYSGSNLTTVTIGNQLAQTNVYTNGRLTEIKDGENNTLVAFAYDAATPGKVARVDTARGMVGFELAATRSGCSGTDKTVLYFNRGNTLSCSVDADCGAGFLCGGKTGTGSTGQCFRAARCLTVDKTAGNHEELVTSVTSLGPPGETCEGACTDVAQYLWDQTTSFVASLGTQDPAGNYTLRERNSNGLPIHITFGDPDSSPTNGNAARDVWLKYDNSTFPGLVTEIRRPSELHAQASSCSATAGDACKRTTIVYNSVGKPSQVTEAGFTLDATGNVVSYSYVTTMTYDTRGRITQIDGPLAGTDDVTVFTYYDGSTDPMTKWYPESISRKKDATNFLTTTVLAYDHWGKPLVVRGADTTASPSSPGTLTCFTYDGNRGHLKERRETMAGQTSCTANSADLVTAWGRDSALRLTQLSRPDGSCMYYEHDTKGRLVRTKRRDDCNPASSGDRQDFILDAEGLVTEVQTYSGGTLTAKQPYTYFDSRKLQRIINPVDTSKWTGLTYDSRGLLAQVDAAGNLGKSVFNRDPATGPGREGRVTSVDRYKTSSLFDRWELEYDWIGSQLRMTDGDSKTTETIRDDMGRVVKLVSPDMTHPTLRIHDSAGRVVTEIEAFGAGGAQQTHAFAHDNLGRLLTANYHGNCPGNETAEIERVYDAPPVTCPVSGGCKRTGGRLAYVRARLMCGGSFGTVLDQETFYSYDDAGRMIQEYIRDNATPTPRTADHLYAWTKAGALRQVTTPSSAVIGWTYGSTVSNSDTDRIRAIWRTSTSIPIADLINWYPYGPLRFYFQKNTINGEVQGTEITRNLAYRITSVAVEDVWDIDTFSVTIGEDAKGRVIKRDYTAAATGVQDSYFLYDDQDRVLCETATLVSTCPTSGTGLKNNQVGGFTNAGDWLQLQRPILGSTAGFNHIFNPSGYGTSHQVTKVSQNNGDPTFGDTNFAYDARGNRIWDDNVSTLTNDRRDYTYDARGNVINVHGRFWIDGQWRDYDVASAYDAKNRRVFKSFLDNTSGMQAHWFFYYDALDRLTEVRHTPDISIPSTYSVFQLFWLEDRLVLYWQTDYPSATTSRRYVGTDETGRPLDMWTWPSTGYSVRAWAINPSAWGFDTNLVGASVFQPILFAGQYQDPETKALQNFNGSTAPSVHRPGLAWNRFRSYDPFTGGYLQVDPLVPETRSSYGYVDSNPVGKSDPLGLCGEEGKNPCPVLPIYGLPSKEQVEEGLCDALGWLWGSPVCDEEGAGNAYVNENGGVGGPGNKDTGKTPSLPQPEDDDCTSGSRCMPKLPKVPNPGPGIWAAIKSLFKPVGLVCTADCTMTWNDKTTTTWVLQTVVTGLTIQQAWQAAWTICNEEGNILSDNDPDPNRWGVYMDAHVHCE